MSVSLLQGLDRLLDLFPFLFNLRLAVEGLFRLREFFKPFFVQLDGKTIPHFLHRKKYEAAETGWYYSQTLKSVQIKYRNPKKDYTVRISFEVFDLIGM